MSRFTKATKCAAKLRMAITGPAGAGKTLTGLILGNELAQLTSTKLAVIDSERGSASLYSDRFAFDVDELTNDQSPQEFVKSIKDAEAEGFGVLVIDSLSHAWIGKNGALKQVDDITARSASNNSYTSWRKVTPIYDELFETILNSDMHVIATMRSKMDYVMETNDRGKKAPKKVGMAPQIRDGSEFEFTLVGDMNVEHQMIISKSRCEEMADKVFNPPTAEIAHTLHAWLDGAPPQAQTHHLASH